MNNKSLLIINDVTGYGRVSSFAMLPVLAQYGIHAYVLPTALVSNTMDYGSAEILDTTKFMRDTINKWEGFGFKFANITTGLVNSKEQAKIICDLIDSQDHPFVIVDPIMADDGILYPDMYEGSIECNREIASRADVIIPNVTEATMLADKYVGRTDLDMNELKHVARAIAKLGPSKVVITGCKANGQDFNIVYNAISDVSELLPFSRTPGTYIGTGDVFSACLAAEMLNGTDLKSAVKKAAQFVSIVVNNNKDNDDHCDLVIESSLSQLSTE